MHENVRRTRPDVSPYWTTGGRPQAFPTLDADTTADVVVVGGGITGLTAAYLLAAAGRSVVLLERARCGGVDTTHTTAHLTMVTDVRLKDLVRQIGRDHARAVWDAGLAALAQIDTLVRNLNIDCRFEWIDGYLHAPASAAATEEEAQALDEEAALARDLGFDAEFVSAVPAIGGPGVRFAGQARFHPQRYLAAITDAFVARGGRVFERSAADEFPRDPRAVKANGRTIRCDDVVVATHNPIVGAAGVVSATLLQTKLALYTSYVVAGRAPRGAIPDALFWDTAEPYQYLRIDPQPDHDVVIFGGEDHKTGQADDTGGCFERLSDVLASRLPGVSVEHRWSGQVIETPDGLPYIGPVTDHQYAATGFAGNGMTFGTLSAMMFADAIAGRRNPWTELFAPDRKALRRSAWDYLKENVDYPYYLIRDRFAGAEGRTLRDVRRGEGRILDIAGRKAAVYRAPDGAVTVRSATCTHMACVVAWNRAERTWDCPCHGSRFTPTGDVLSGPAEKPLAKLGE